MFNQDQSLIHQYSLGMSSTISMNKQNDYSHIASTWKGTQLDAAADSSEIPPTPIDTCNNSNTIENNLQEDAISSKSQRSNTPPVQMVCIPKNQLDKNKTRKLIKSTKRYKYLVNHQIRLNSQQIKKHMTKECKNIDHKPTTDENTSSKTNSVDNMHEKNKDNSEITFGDQICKNPGDFTRILYKNIGSLGLTCSARPLEEICDFMLTWKVDICCLVETNTH